MRIDLSDLDRLDGIAEALGRLFWCLIVVAFFGAILGSAGTGLLVLILAGASFCARVGIEDFVRGRRGREERPTEQEERPARPRRIAKAERDLAPMDRFAPRPEPAPEPEFTVYRSSRRPRRARSVTELR